MAKREVIKNIKLLVGWAALFIAIVSVVYSWGGFFIHVADDRSILETWNLTWTSCKIGMLPSLFFAWFSFATMQWGWF